MIRTCSQTFFSCLSVLAAAAPAVAQDEPGFAHLAGQSAMAPASAQAGGINTLWWVMLIGGTIIFVIVMAILAWGLWQGRGAEGRHLSWRASRNLVIAAGGAIPLAVLVTLVGGSLVLGNSLSRAPADAMVVEVTGWQWWWEIRYLDESGEVIATTANELHVPVGEPVVLRLRSKDVIHSFWVPELNGKTDLVPGYINTSWFEADRPGVFRGQCSEFCGTQHALMAFLVIAQPREQFAAWLANQQAPAAEPQSEAARRGREVFLNQPCAGCHSIRGTRAVGVLGPDLTHFGSRRTLGAATRPNTTGHLGGWIANPQGIKPGNLMPPTPLTGRELTDLIAYLQSLE